jgi:hypothetical protein
MRTLLIFAVLTVFQIAQAKVVEKTPVLEAPNVQVELMQELNETPEDLDFDSEDDLQIQSIDEEKLVIDTEIEMIASDKNTLAPKVEAKAAPTTTNVKKK